MGKVNIRMEGIKLLTPGKYNGRIMNAQIEPSKTSDYPNLVVTYIVESTDEKEDGRELKAWYSTKPNAVWSMTRLMDRLDIPYESVLVDPDDETSPEILSFDPDDFCGKSCVLTIAIDTYKGKRNNKVEEVFGPV